MSSFRKRTIVKTIKGTKISLQNGLTITSTGNPSLDHILGGGLPIGSLLLIEEDRFAIYSKVLIKYFIAEAIFSEHSVFYGTLDESANEFLTKLPKPVENMKYLDEQQQSLASPSLLNQNEEMRIAWRYNELPKINLEQLSQNQQIGHHFNLMEKIDEETLKNADAYTWNDFSSGICAFASILKEISNLTNQPRFSNHTDSGEEKCLLKICIALGSPPWYCENFQVQLLKFLTFLRWMVKNINAVCLLTIPTNLLKVLDENLPKKIRNLVDYSFELESFAGSDKETNPVFKDYNGIVHVRKLNAVNSLSAYKPDATDLAFKLRRKKFVIEKLHLPPELQDKVDLQQNQSAEIVPTMSCGSVSSKNNLDF